eukprot:scaffold100706_cov70-Phaeocystis_antarctica.AAC.1
MSFATLSWHSYGCTAPFDAINNCCSVGASWEGTCGDGLTHTWLAGYSVCNGDNGVLSQARGCYRDNH